MPCPSAQETNISRITQAIRELWNGRSNAVGFFALEVSPATSTTVTAINCGARSRILLSPRTANAAAAMASGDLYVSSVTQGQFTVTHAASENDDLDFDYVAIG